MPSLNIDDAFDAEFLDPLTLSRAVQTTGSNGIAVNTPALPVRFYGVVCAAGGKDLQRLPEAQRTAGSISIVTREKLLSGDLVSWNGQQYTVRHWDDYSRYGSGFIQAVATLLPIVL